MTRTTDRAAETASPETTDGPGLLLALTSAATFGMAGSLGAGLIAAGWSPAATVTSRALVSALVLLGPGLWLVRDRLGVLARSTRSFLVYGGIAVAGTQLCYMYAVARIPVGVALLIEYLAPVLLVGWAWLRHGRRPTTATTVGTFLAIGGLLLVLDLSGTTSLDPVGLAWALAAAVGLSVYFIASADTSSPLPPLTLTAGSMVVAAALLAAAGGLGLLPLTATDDPVALLGATVPAVVAVLLLGLVCGATAYATGIAAARRLGPTVASFAGLTEVLFAVLFAWLLLGQGLTPIQVLGGVGVLAGVALVRAGERGGATTTPDPLPDDTEPSAPHHDTKD